MFHVPEINRITKGRMASDSSFGNNGCFVIESIKKGRTLYVIASNGMGWEHVSVHVLDGKEQRTPTWREMCFIKDLFWDGEDVVIQYHPMKSEYVNNHPFTLHLWRPTELMIPRPPPILVGVQQGRPILFNPLHGYGK